MSDSLSQSQFSLSTIDTQPKVLEEQFLRFFLEPQTRLMLPIEQITAVLNIGVGQIVPIPQMPSWVMGVYNWRGNILWMVDLGHLIGFNSWYEQGINTSNYTAIVITPDKTDGSQVMGDELLSLGAIVTRVEDLEWCNTELIQSPPTSSVTQALAPFLRGYWLDCHEEMILVLDGKAIVTAMPQTSRD
ncbi:MAG: chemotaxis protein CheW [Pleurocapsa sp.]